MTDVEYGVNVSNKYSMFYDEDHDPNEFIAQQLVAAPTRKSAEEKAAKKKEKKAAASQPTLGLPATTVSGTDKKPAPTQAPQNQTKAATDASKQGGGRSNFDSNKAPRSERDEKENKPARQFGEHRGGSRPPRGDRGPRQQDRSNLPPRMGGGGFNSGTGGEHQQFDQGFQQQEDRGGFGGRGRGGRRGGFGGRGRGGRGGGGFNQGEESGGGFGFNAVDNNQGFGVSPGGGGNEGGGFGTFGGEDQGGGGGGFGASDRPYRGRGRGRGRGGGRGFGRGRQFDRVSGSDRTGIKPMEKRDGSGPYNWGSQNEGAGENEVLNTPAEGDQQPPAEGGDEEKTRASGDEVAHETDDAAAKEAEEAAQRELTLDEWKAQQGPKAKPAFNIRRAGEGEGEKAEWKKLIPLARTDATPKKDADESYEDEEEGDEGHQKKKAKEIPIEINFIDGGGFARGTRGGRGSRGGRGRGGPRGGGGGNDEGFGARRSGGFGGRGGGEGGFGGRGNGGGGGFGGQSEGSGGRGRGGGRRDVPYKMDEESFPQLSSSAAA